VSVDEHRIELGSAPVFYRSAAPPAPPGPAPLYLHDVPTSSDDWLPLLARAGGIAPDLIGFGRSSKAVNLDYSVPGLADFAEDLLAVLGVDATRLVGHGWGAAVALELARRRAEQFDRLVLINPLPLVDGFGWSRIARGWRIRFVGELMMGSTQRWMLARALRRASANPAIWSNRRIATIWKQFDQGTQRAILRLHRSVDDPPRTPPVATDAQTLLIWGERDPWFPVEHAGAYCDLVANTKLETVAGAGHWPWLDRPELVDRVAAFLQPA
jgi:pimeloyl-ACP methyl ester carboxylesterase